jgi:Ig-like domain from next to BRCA1 gene
VLTQHGDAQRTGAALFETRTPADVQSGSFARLFEWDVDGQIYAQPLYLSGVAYQGRTINMVVVATMNNSVYAFEAPVAGSDARPSEDPLWHVCKDTLGEPLPFDFFSMQWGIFGHNIEPLIGVTATPAIDRASGTIYVTAKSGSSGFLGLFKSVTYRLFAIDLLTGAVKRSVDIDAKFTGPDGSTATFDAKHQLQRTGLALANGRVYLGFGSHQDSPPYHGWVLAYDANDLRQTAAYCTTCGSAKSKMGGIWQAGGGPAVDGDGDLFVMTGNGSFGAESGDRGTSFVKLDKDLRVLGSWTPASYECLNKTDADLGSAGPLFLASTSTLIGGGKEGVLYALQPDALRGTHVGTGTPGHAAYPCYSPSDPTPDPSGPGYWSIQAAPTWQSSALMDVLRSVEPTILSQGFHHIHGSPVTWTVHEAGGDRTLVYVSAERDLLRAYAFDHGFSGATGPGQAPKATYQSLCTNSDHGMPGGFLTLSANGGDPGSGIVWASMPRRDKDALHNVVPGILRAYRAYPDANGTLVEIWNSDGGTRVPAPGDCRDGTPKVGSEVGLFAKYAAPTVAEGKVYLPTFSGQLDVYGVRRAAAAAPESYDAELESSPLPPVVEPGASVAVVVTAKNTGTATWHPGDDVHLRARKMPRALAEPIEGPSALAVTRDVAPGQTFTFAFHLRAPSAEATYYLDWRLARRTAGGRSPLFGSKTPEWSFAALRAECADLRDRMMKVLDAVPPGQLLAPSQRAEAADIRQLAESRRCALLPDSMAPMRGGR